MEATMTTVRRSHVTTHQTPAKPTQETAAAAAPVATTQAGKAKASPQAVTTPALPPQADTGWIGGLDSLWAAGKFPEVVNHIDQRLAPLKAGSFEKLDPVALGGWVEELYVLQHRMIAVCNKLSMKESPEASKKALTVLQTLGDLQTAVFRRAVEMSNAKDPAPVTAWAIYRNTMKKPGFHSPTEGEAYFVEKAKKFIAAGGDPTMIKTLSMDFLKSVKNDELCEWVVDAHDTARVASADVEPTPGHTLLSWGNDALGAGSFKVFKNDKGDISQVVVGTFSGHFRSGIEAIPNMVRHLVAIGVPPEKIKIQEGEAASFRTMELVNRLTGLQGAEAQNKETALVAEATRWNPYERPSSPDKPKHPAVDVGKRPSADAPKLAQALLAMKETIAEVMGDALVLQSLGEADKVAAALTNVLTLAEKAGDPGAHKQAMAVLTHLASLKVPMVDDAAATMLQDLHATWGAKAFGSGAVDAADVLSPRPPADRRARIVATLNPKADEATLREMITAGMDVARLNTAHGTPQELLATIKRVRSAAASLGKTVQVQVDLSGPKIRLGKFANPQNLEFNDIFLKPGEKLKLTTADVLGTPQLLPVDYPTLAKDVKPGDPIMLNDGNVVLKATSVTVDPRTGVGTVEAEVVTGGKVWDRKGINLPGSALSVDTVTEEDLQVLDVLLKDVDIVAPSFVRSPMDILMLRAEMQKRGHVCPILAKIERPEALTHLNTIAALADGLMVARGDLGVEIGPENVPAAERAINEVGNRLGKPTMVATEVLMSMVKDSRPTRADVEALYSAIHDQGADAIMLAKETSFGAHPAEVIRTAGRVISKAEEDTTTRTYSADRMKAVVEGTGAQSLRDLMLGRR
jgi:pyruvate kinase